MRKAKIIIFDIETSPVENLRFQKDRSPYISSNTITHDSYMISAAWKVLGEKSIHFVASQKVWDDFKTVKTLRNILASADILIGHNIDKFDLKYLNARLIYHSLPPLPIIATVDTLKEVKKVAFFTGHSLGYLASYILDEEKINVNFDLWKKVVNGNKSALKEMVAYNKQDVVVTEKWYNHLKPYMKTHPHMGVFTGENRLCSCNKCGGTHLKKNGFRVTTAGLKKQEIQCLDCGSYQRIPVGLLK